ncbi:methylaspartate mutase [Motilibacter deserti]|uniref:Methylaspartate mutase n=1 Tax=Motilibacter deserti TaxID=2714956 RepID=A0ABX0H1Z7_9ACTN|nr:methylaspartate mutase [Motilibacter deserti]NHC15960.1 methylaspartate mutase [Motilibacter deserti]
MPAAVRAARERGELLVQPRMGFSDPARMRAGLLATRAARGATVGTLTLDSYTRVGDVAAAARALATGVPLNGYPITSHALDITRGVLDRVAGPGFPVQVRHGSPLPESIFRTLTALGLDATEGGPVSYCLPYGRVPLRRAVDSWARSCDRLARAADEGGEPHLESFGGCMLGQLCPPSLLVALTVLEAAFFVQHGLRSVSVSFAQQTNAAQDAEALLALRRLARQFLPGVDWHVVVYTYMGVYPRTPGGAALLLSRAAELAASGAERLIVKTPAEAYRIPTVDENVAALELAAAAARAARPLGPGDVSDTGVYVEARALIEAVLDLDPDIGTALVRAFAAGYLDVPYCLHADNRGAARATLDAEGRLRWSSVGAMPIAHLADLDRAALPTSSGLLAALTYVQRTCDADAAAPAPSLPLEGARL